MPGVGCRKVRRLQALPRREYKPELLTRWDQIRRRRMVHQMAVVFVTVTESRGSTATADENSSGQEKRRPHYNECTDDMENLR